MKGGHPPCRNTRLRSKALCFVINERIEALAQASYPQVALLQQIGLSFFA